MKYLLTFVKFGSDLRVELSPPQQRMQWAIITALTSKYPRFVPPTGLGARPSGGPYTASIDELWQIARAALPKDDADGVILQDHDVREFTFGSIVTI